MYSVGNGYDIHRLVRGKKLILCGEHIEYKKGLLGHSDADVAVHALIDSLLGAAGLGDIGVYFPDTDAKFKGANSIELLREVVHILKYEKSFEILNVDITIIAQAPKLVSYADAMKNNISAALQTKESRVNVKSKTNERLGEIGHKKAIACFSSALLKFKV